MDTQEINSTDTKDQNIHTNSEGYVRVYKQRWIILILFVFSNIAGIIQLMQYVIVTDVIRQYYQVSYTAIEWTAMIYSLLYALIILPGSHIIEKLGVRKTILIGSIGILVGTCIKFGSIHPDRFWVAFLGQTIVVAFQVLQGTLLPKLAAVWWFGYNQIATACAIGVVGYQAGMALSFLIPPIFVKGSNEEIKHGLYLINIGYAVLNAIVLLSLLFGFKDSPPTPPSIAQKNYTKKREESPLNFITEIKSLLTNKNYILFAIVQGINVASSIPSLILSNQIILTYYEDGSYHVAVLGALNSGLSIIGSMGASVCLDKLKKFRLISITAHALYGLSIVLYTTTLTEGIHFVYISTVMMGICFGSLITIAMEVVVELTYPLTQNLTVGVYSAFAELAAIVVTSIFCYEINSTDTKDQNIHTNSEGYVRVYKQRWIILILFVFSNITGYIQIMQYVIVTDAIREYHQVSYTAIEWTSMVYSLLYTVLILPGSHIIEKLGVRKAVVIGSIGTLVGTCIKCGSVHPDRFWVAFLGQSIVVAFQVLQATLLPKLAAVWFGYNQIATACAIGFVGYQVGMTLSFLIPPIFIKGSNEEIRQGLYITNISYAVLRAIVLLLLLFGFKDSPPTPPSTAQKNYTKEREENPVNFITEIKSLFTNKNYILFTIVQGINIASAYPSLVLSNQIILTYYEDGSYHVGVLGFLSTGLSIIGSMGASACMDKLKKFRLISVTALALYVLSIVLYTTTLSEGIHFVYISTVIMGICFGSLITIAMEVVVELTYPLPQNLTVGVFTAFVELAGIVVTSIFAPILRSFGFNYASMILIGTVLVADLLYIFIKFDLRRQAAEVKTSNVDLKMT